MRNRPAIQQVQKPQGKGEQGKRKKPQADTVIPFPGVTPKKKRKSYNQAEYKLQVACLKWLDFFYPELHDKRKRFHVPNRGEENSKRGYFNKQMGVMPGVADLIILVRRRGHSGLIIDFKSGDGELSTEQREFFTSMQEEGFWVKAVNSFDEFTAVVENYLGESPRKQNYFR